MLRGQASLQDIIGKPQSWRSGKAKQKNKKPIFPASNEEDEVPIKREDAGDGLKEESKITIAVKTEQEIALARQVLQTCASDAQALVRAQSVRRSPRKVQNFSQQSGLPNCPLQCPVCSKSLPASITEINRHIGEAFYYFTHFTPYLCMQASSQISIAVMPAIGNFALNLNLYFHILYSGRLCHHSGEHSDKLHM